jgi:CelD/BcsL family acetyltransferase involved in cellulose biosynthesis
LHGFFEDILCFFASIVFKSAEFVEPLIDNTRTLIKIGQYQIERISDPRLLAPIAEAWDAAYEKALVPTPSSSYAAISSFAEHLRSPEETFCCLVATKNGIFRGILPLIVRKQTSMGRTRLLLSTVRHSHVIFVDMVGVAEDSIGIRNALLQSCGHYFPRFTRLDLTHIPAESHTIQALTHQPSKLYFAVHPQGFSSYFDTSVSIESYFSQLSGKFNRDVRRNIKQFFSLPGARIEFLSGDDATDEAFESFLALEVNGWKGAREGAIANNSALTSFYKSVVTSFRAQGWLEIHLAHADSKIVAAQLAVKVGRVLYPKKIAYSEEYAKYAPGKVLIARTIERAHADPNTDMIDSLGESDWIRHWSVAKRPLVRVAIYSSFIRCWLQGHLKPRIGRWLKRFPVVARYFSSQPRERNIT